MPLPPEATRGVQWLADGIGLLPPAEGQHGPASLLLTAGDDVVLVDAGLPAEQRRALAPHVTVCLLTHCHVAHAKGARDFREVWAPREEADAMRSIEDYLGTYHVGRRDRDLVAAGVRKAGYEPAPIHKRLRAGSVITLDGQEWHVLAAPGHSQGLIALHEPKRHFVFAADLDGEGPPWYGWPSSDPSELERTYTMLSEIPTAVYATSRGQPRRRGIKPMLRALAESIRERDRLLLTALEVPRGLDDLSEMGMFLGKSQDALHRYHERVMVEKHLSRLLEKDFAHARQDGRFQRIS